jgi:hypothetical protein
MITYKSYQSALYMGGNFGGTAFDMAYLLS